MSVINIFITLIYYYYLDIIIIIYRFIFSIHIKLSGDNLQKTYTGKRGEKEKVRITLTLPVRPTLVMHRDIYVPSVYCPWVVCYL